ncbi:TadE/TadG family type IV pilus assembly protein [Methylobacterium dankookense]|uniref:TadE-like domain-containing protein n=1 Tax=Methylobacterium dankookense TaxID=560405 RepID=A0A564FT57_9HYPH|nr:TadE/TadG family type IV pilus assembly protein [Methylobacterium dankookense]GJD59591.1 hypothetical protein IFDJLNFL_5520 [Methylobacterium dankookense]VUF10880.1 hypothetical protein MTDSW087_00552 [Methylobacterium dankookense]
MRHLMSSRAPRGSGRMRALLACRRFRAARGGIAAVEFAMVLPILLTIFVGLSEYAHAIDSWRKLTLLARTVSDMTAQGDTQNPISPALVTDILASSALVMRPLDPSTVKIVVSAMGVNLTGATLIPKVCSSVANANAVKRTVGIPTDLTVPAGFQGLGMRYVLTEVSMDYRPMIGSALVKLFGNTTGTVTLKASFPWPTRGGAKVAPNTYNEVILPDPDTKNAKPC